MPRTINPIRKAKVKKALKEGKSARQAMLDADYSLNTAINATKKKVVKDCTDELIEEFKLSDITVEYVISRLTSLANNAENDAVKAKSLELLGKYLALWTDKQQVDSTIITKEEENIISKYVHSNRLDN